VAGVKERFLAYKMKIAFCDFNHDRTANFEGYDGMKNFAQEVCNTLNSPVWQLPVKRASCIVNRNQDYVEAVISDDIPEPCSS